MTASQEPRVVVLAAGASARLGEPKALVDLGGRSVLERLLAASGSDEAALIVTGAHHSAIARAVAGLPAAACELVENRAWAAGRTGGLALAAARAPGRALLVAPVDVPLVPRAVFDSLRAAWRGARAPARGWLAPIAPRAGGSDGEPRPGHPIVIGHALAAELAGMGPDQPLRDLRAAADPVLSVSVGDPSIHDDLDTPADLEALRGRLDRA